MTAKTRTDLKASMDTDIADNVGGDISAADVRENVKDAADSAIFPEDIPAQLGISTGWLSGGEITINADPTKFDVAAGTGVVVTSTDPTNITYSKITWSAATALTPIGLATQATSFVRVLDAGGGVGTIEQSEDYPVNGVLRSKVNLGGMSHADNVNVDAVSDFTSAVPFNIAPALTDFINAMGVINVSGNAMSGSGNANLKFEISAGRIFFLGIATKTQPDNENHIDSLLENEPDIVFSWRDGAGGFNTKITDAITAGVYDDGTGGASDPQGTVTTNNWVNCRWKKSPDLDRIVLEFGDASHSNSADAIAALKTDGYGDNPSFVGFPVIGYLSLRGAAISTDDVPADAVFTKTNKFGLL